MRILLYVGNIPDSATAADLEELFRPHGTVVAARTIADPRTGRSLGYGFVEMAEGAEAAIRAVHGTPFHGRSLTVREQRRYPDEYTPDESPEFHQAVEGSAGTGRNGRPGRSARARGHSLLPRPVL